MCGRGHVASSATDIANAANTATNRPSNWEEGGKKWDGENRHVLHPGCDVPVIFRDHTGTSSSNNIIAPMTFGLVPSFSKGGGKPNYFRFFNAKSETCSTVSVYSRLLKQKRCVVVFDGFFEWKDDWKKEKQPYYVTFKTRPMFIAGLYDVIILVSSLLIMYSL
jgi:putative SOS response-associated peptidase YedK